jgi:hypothetical protein
MDTSAVLDCIDRAGAYLSVDQIAEWHKSGKIMLFVSSRVQYPDTQKMDETQKRKLRQWLTQNSIVETESSWRVGISPVGGPDVIGKPLTHRSENEMERFEIIVGPNPAPGKTPEPELKRRWGNMTMNTLERKIGDYDALYDHYAAERDVFITLDTRDYFGIKKRERYKKELNLVVQSPEEFVREHQPEFGSIS